MPELPASAARAAVIPELVRNQAAVLGDRPAFAFLEDGRRESGRLSFADLDREARRIAAWLQRDHAPGERALLLFPAGLDFIKAFLGCLYAGLIAIPAPPPEASRRKRTLPRLLSIARDSEVSVALSSGDVLDLLHEAPELSAVKTVDLAEAAQADPAAWRPAAAASDDIAYLQYTSGSTTAPKGVLISHGNVLHHCRDLRAGCGYGPDSVSVTWLPYFHDYGLIEGILTPLQNGTPCHVMSPFAFLKRPFAWLSAVSRLRATHTQAPNFAFDQCVRRIKPEQRAELDLSCLVNIGDGAEPINPKVLDAFASTFAPCGLQPTAIGPAYGLAEATLMATCRGPGQVPRIGSFEAEALARRQLRPTEPGGPNARRVVSCGPPLGEIRLAIVDPDTRRACGPDEVGEVWIKDPCVALGYWRQPEATRETFRATLADTGEGPFLRTGDLGFLHEGELHLTSRLKDLIIVAGANHYPQDIEWTVEEAHPAIRAGHAAACTINVDGEERLLIAPEVERGALGPETEQALLAAVRRTVSEAHELPVQALLILKRGSLPKTASGKIQRHACERFFMEMGPEVESAWTSEDGWIKRASGTSAGELAENM